MPDLSIQPGTAQYIRKEVEQNNRTTSISTIGDDQLLTLLISMEQGDYLHMNCNDDRIEIRKEEHPYGGKAKRCAARCLRPIPGIGQGVAVFVRKFHYRATDGKFPSQKVGFRAMWSDTKQVGKGGVLSLHLDRQHDAQLGLDVSALTSSKSPFRRAATPPQMLKGSLLEGQTPRVDRITYDVLRKNAIKAAKNRLGDAVKGRLEDLTLRQLLAPNHPLRKLVALDALKKNGSLTKDNLGLSSDHELDRLLNLLAVKVADASQNFVQLADLLDSFDSEQRLADLNKLETNAERPKQALNKVTEKRNELFKKYSGGVKYKDVKFEQVTEEFAIGKTQYIKVPVDLKTNRRIDSKEYIELTKAKHKFTKTASNADKKSFSALQIQRRNLQSKLAKEYMEPRAKLETVIESGNAFMATCVTEFKSKHNKDVANKKTIPQLSISPPTNDTTSSVITNDSSKGIQTHAEQSY